ncbi:MAG: right-handed parallel beta-helix repeat-containing protein [Actinomycetota bacterium]|nr:right-handed parallel beta-helix repeat-containing protein [Actinomycetota bacterium]
MSYTLRGRIESRLAPVLFALAIALVLAAAEREWWPLQLAAVMAGVGLVLDVLVYNRLLEYQPGWAALPLGALELGLVVLAARGLDIHAPFAQAVALFGVAWLAAQVLGHAVLPLVRLTYAQDGGELGRAGPAVAAAVVAVLAGAAGTAYAMRPPVVHLAAGVHQGPLVIDERQTLVGEPGAVVRGGIVVRASGVTIRNVVVVGGTNGIEVDEARNVLLDRVSVSGAQLDGIHVRHSNVEIRNCNIDSGTNPWAQGIDISFAYDLPPSMVKGCTITGGREGIVTHSVQTMLVGNHVRSTQLRGISVTEMSMGMVEHNDVHDALGIGIYCGDRSMCEIDHNVVSNTRVDHASEDVSRHGYPIVAWWESEAELHGNVLVGNSRGAGSFASSRIRWPR